MHPLPSTEGSSRSRAEIAPGDRRPVGAVADRPARPSFAHKLCDLGELGRLLEDLRAVGRTIVHCHGCFDLLHPGHIHHLESAKREGDVLVVTITPDRHVEKGPGRPVFNERLRAESVAALHCVDFVSVNHWPTAVETIDLLRPDVFVKGGEYRDRASDVTGNISREERAVVGAGGRVHFTNGLTFSSAKLLNHYFDVLSPPARAFLTGLRERFSAADVISRLRSLRGLRIAVVGDAIVEELHLCRPQGVDETMTSIVAKTIERQVLWAGSFGIAERLAGLCDEVRLVTVVGDEVGHELPASGDVTSTVRPRLFHMPGRRVPRRRRFLHASSRTPLFESHDLDQPPISAELDGVLASHLRSVLAEVDVAVAVDLGLETLGAETVGAISGGPWFSSLVACGGGRPRRVRSAMLRRHRGGAFDHVAAVLRDGPGGLPEDAAMTGRVLDELVGACPGSGITIALANGGAVARGPGSVPVTLPPFSREVPSPSQTDPVFLALAALCSAGGFEPELGAFVASAGASMAAGEGATGRAPGSVGLFKCIKTLLSH